MKSRLSFGLATLLAVLLSACGSTDPCAYARDVALSPSALTLTSGEHGAGWGRTECFQCHQRYRIHRTDCTDVADIDTAALNDMVDPADTTTCIQCHGTNGVPEWLGLDERDSDSGGAP